MLKKKEVTVLGHAKGNTVSCTIDHLQAVAPEQIPTAKRWIIRKFSEMGISESEINFEIQHDNN